MYGTKPYVKVSMRFNEIITQQNAVFFVDKIIKIMKENSSRLIINGIIVVLSLADFRVPDMDFQAVNSNPVVRDVSVTTTTP
ncbi:hypothetical protein DPMN_189873 [Dreissena polymorpha]|uniref:Uncharacterized protein n=1 Tax=Dreissena polymorpha TaxID=45954 RepID=A0A9D4IBF3_DREPO|nr:hypothetical protein DPMN_189873 [Dreissena polymorpha]